MTSRKRILVIEDDAGIRRAVVDALVVSGYEVEQTDRAAQGLQWAMSHPIDLVLLDLVLPLADGRTVLRQLRQSGFALPVIIMTACGFESQRIEGLKDGADDYVVKPFSIKELLARIEAVLRRSPQRAASVTTAKYSGGRIDFEKCEVVHDTGHRESLSEKEFELLRYLARHPSRVISREEILKFVWQLEPTGIHTRTIDMHIARLREKLGDVDKDPKTLITVRGKGYRIELLPGTEHQHNHVS